MTLRIKAIPKKKSLKKYKVPVLSQDRYFNNFDSQYALPSHRLFETKKTNYLFKKLFFSLEHLNNSENWEEKCTLTKNMKGHVKRNK